MNKPERKTDKKYNFIFQFDGRRSFVLDQPTPFTGLKIGVEYMQVHDFGLGFYATREPVRAKPRKGQHEILAQIDYNTLFYQYAFYHDKKWEFSLPFHYGGGRTTIREVYAGTDINLVDEFGNDRVLPEINYSVAEFGIGGQFKILKWFGIGSGLGYRFTFSSEENVKKLINSTTYSFKFKLFLGELYRSINDHYSYENQHK